MAFATLFNFVFKLEQYVIYLKSKSTKWSNMKCNFVIYYNQIKLFIYRPTNTLRANKRPKCVCLTKIFQKILGF